MDAQLHIPLEVIVTSFNLEEVNANPGQDWSYNIRQYPNDYGMYDLSPNSYSILANTIKTDSIQANLYQSDLNKRYYRTS